MRITTINFYKANLNALMLLLNKDNNSLIEYNQIKDLSRTLRHNKIDLRELQAKIK